MVILMFEVGLYRGTAKVIVDKERRFGCCGMLMTACGQDEMFRA